MSAAGILPRMPLRRPLSLSFALRGVQAAAGNTLIALALTAFGDEPFARNLLYSQLIGLSIWLAMTSARCCGGACHRSGPGAA